MFRQTSLIGEALTASCSKQLLRWLQDRAEQFGSGILQTEVPTLLEFMATAPPTLTTSDLMNQWRIICEPLLSSGADKPYSLAAFLEVLEILGSDTVWQVLLDKYPHSRIRVSLRT